MAKLLLPVADYQAGWGAAMVNCCFCGCRQSRQLRRSKQSRAGGRTREVHRHDKQQKWPSKKRREEGAAWNRTEQSQMLKKGQEQHTTY